MTNKELFSEWNSMKQLLKGGLLADIGIIVVSILLYFTQENRTFLIFTALGFYLMIILICALRIHNKENNNGKLL